MGAFFARIRNISPIISTFRRRIILTFLGIFLVFLIFLGIWHYRNMLWLARENFQDSIRIISHQLARQSVSDVYSENPDGLARIASNAMLFPDIIQIVFYNRSKNVLYQHQKPVYSKVCPPCKPDAICFGDTLVFHTGETDQFSACQPIFLEPETVEGKETRPTQCIGWVMVSFALNRIQTGLTNVTSDLIITEGIAAILFCLLLFVLERWVSRPLIHLTEKVQLIAKGDLSVRVEHPPTHDEIGLLGRSINQMADALQVYADNLHQLLQQKIGEIESKERQLMYQEKMASLGRMSANIAHEINNPLNYISLGVDYLEGQEKKVSESIGATDEGMLGKRRDTLRDIRRGIQKVEAIITSLRKFSRSNEASAEEYSLSEAFDEALKLIHHTIVGRGIVLERNVQWAGRLKGSVVSVEQIFLNLFSNSVDAFQEAATPNPRILVKWMEEAENIRIVFDDNGPGIDPRNIHRVFEPFFTTKPSGKGTGLGLALSYELAAREGGRLKLGVTELGGIAFELILPKHAP
ncbi:MAG: integral membrane sensor signal transduction histidine kinase [uncultured bacterium]|nr:MAG: integral membrane sensor signal transduction histidine kinase [uncultured bacterium]